jgi:hypothetical protein
LEDDSAFQYQTRVKVAEGESYDSRRVYFDRDNGFLWVNSHGSSGDRIQAG